MYDLSFFVSLCTGFVHIEPPDLPKHNEVSLLHENLARRARHTADSLTVDASRDSFPPFPVGVLPGRPESLECFGFRVSTTLVLALPMTG